MTEDQAVHLDNLRLNVETRAAEAAERCRAQAAFEAGAREFPALGAEAMADHFRRDVETWRAQADRHGVLAEALEDPEPVEDEPEGLTEDLLLLYRQWRAQMAAV